MVSGELLSKLATFCLLVPSAMGMNQGLAGEAGRRSPYLVVRVSSLAGFAILILYVLYLAILAGTSCLTAKNS